MCESNVYMIDREGHETLYFESVDRIVPTESGLYMENVFSETKNVKARIKEMALVGHRIVIEEERD